MRLEALTVCFFLHGVCGGQRHELAERPRPQLLQPAEVEARQDRAPDRDRPPASSQSPTMGKSNKKPTAQHYLPYVDQKGLNSRELSSAVSSVHFTRHPKQKSQDETENRRQNSPVKLDPIVSLKMTTELRAIHNSSLANIGSKSKSSVYVVRPKAAGKDHLSIALQPEPEQQQQAEASTPTTQSAPNNDYVVLKDAFLVQNPRPLPLSDWIPSKAHQRNRKSPSWNRKDRSKMAPQHKTKTRKHSSMNRDDGRDRAGLPTSLPAAHKRSVRCTSGAGPMNLPVGAGHGPLPWECREHYSWRHLGENTYPSRVYEADCLPGQLSCWYGHFNCTPVPYTLQVLRACDPAARHCRDTRVPAAFRTRWEFRSLNVTVGCKCSAQRNGG